MHPLTRSLAATTLFLPLFAPAALALDLRAAAAYSAAQRGEALVVLQEGREVYADGQNRFDLNAPHILASGSKSFGCAMAVAAQDDGLLSLDEPVSRTIEEWRGEPAKARVTIRQLLSFTSGLPGSAADPLEVARTENLNLVAIALPLTAEPGTRYTYGNAHLAVFNELMRRKTGAPADAYLLRRVLQPIGVNRIEWTRDRAGNAQLAGGARLNARDWARYGQLVLQQGRWNSTPVLSSAGLRECLQGSSALASYGLTWWLNQPLAGTLDAADVVPMAALGFAATDRDGQIAPSAPGDLFMAAGAFNQRLYILRSQQLVVVRFGAGGPWQDEEFLRRLLR